MRFAYAQGAQKTSFLAASLLPRSIEFHAHPVPPSHVRRPSILPPFVYEYTPLRPLGLLSVAVASL